MTDLGAPKSSHFESQEPMALWNLKRLAPRVLVASWAPPHVPGPGHVNPRENAEAWRSLEEVPLPGRWMELGENPRNIEVFSVLLGHLVSFVVLRFFGLEIL